MGSAVDTGEKRISEDNIRVLTIGHSSMSIDDFLTVLRQTGVTAVADVRTSPFSRRLPHFSRDELRAALSENNIRYVFLGQELGGRPKDRRLYCDGVADYGRMALEPAFLEGLDRVIKGARAHTIALMCSEQNPLDCHRCLLVARALTKRDISVGHIVEDGRIVDQPGIEEKLLDLTDYNFDDLFASRGERLDMAYKSRARKVAFQERDLDSETHKLTSEN